MTLQKWIKDRVSFWDGQYNYILRIFRAHVRMYNKVCRFCFRKSMKLSCKGNCWKRQRIFQIIFKVNLLVFSGL